MTLQQSVLDIESVNDDEAEELRSDVQDGNVEDEADTDNLVIPIQYDITSFGADYDAEGLVKRLQRKDIYIPDFQRSYVWSQKEASRFIESLLLGLPVPGVFLARDIDSKRLLVIDGQQRLKTIQFFFEGIFNPQLDAKVNRVFKLLDVQKQFLNLTYETLNDDDRILLNDSIIHATIIKQESPEGDDTSIYHIFERLNTSGRKLTPQQIRVAIYPGNFINMIQQLNKYPKWREIFGPRSATLKDQELILRFFALYFEADTYTRPMKEFLNKFTQKKRLSNDKFIVQWESLFTSTIDVIHNSIGTRAFRPERALNTATFDSVMVGVARRIQLGTEIDYKALKETYFNLFNNPEYMQTIESGTSDDKSVKERLRISTEKFSKV